MILEKVVALQIVKFLESNGLLGKFHFGFRKYTLDFGINIGVRLLIFEKKIEGKKMKNDHNALFDVKTN